MGRFVADFDGTYITAEDVNVGIPDLRAGDARPRTSPGSRSRRGRRQPAGGDRARRLPRRRAALEATGSGEPTEDRGHPGSRQRRVRPRPARGRGGGRLVAADVNAERVARAVDELGAEAVAPRTSSTSSATSSRRARSAASSTTTRSRGSGARSSPGRRTTSSSTRSGTRRAAARAASSTRRTTSSTPAGSSTWAASCARAATTSSTRGARARHPGHARGGLRARPLGGDHDVRGRPGARRGRSPPGRQPPGSRLPAASARSAGTGSCSRPGDEKHRSRLRAGQGADEGLEPDRERERLVRLLSAEWHERVRAGAPLENGAVRHRPHRDVRDERGAVARGDRDREGFVPVSAARRRGAGAASARSRSARRPARPPPADAPRAEDARGEAPLGDDDRAASGGWSRVARTISPRTR